MSKLLNKIRNFFKKRTWITLIIVCAALLLELFSAAQYYNSKKILEAQADKMASVEMTMKAVLIKSMLNASEQVLNSHEDYIAGELSHPETLGDDMQSILQANSYFQGVGIALDPRYYNHDNELFELWGFNTNNGIEVRQIAKRGGHDYTNLKFYTEPMKTGKPYWSDPYIDNVQTHSLITTYSIPIHDNDSQLAGIAGIDLSLKWLNDTLNERHIYPSSFCILLTENGEPISQLSKDHPYYKDFKEAIRVINDPSIESDTVNKSKIKVKEFYSKIDGRDVCVFYHHMKGNPHWQLALVCYDNEIYGELDKLRLRMSLLMLLGFLLLGYIIYRFLKNNKRMAQNERERDRIDTELQVAKRIQSEMLPHDDLSHDNIDIAGTLLAAREVGGDIYDYFLRDDKLFFCIGDASGKGVASALIMSVTHSMFRSFGSRESHPARIMQKINQAVCHGNESSMFVTFFIGVLDLPTGRLHYCNAGHDTPLIIMHNAQCTMHNAQSPISDSQSPILDAQPLEVISNIPLGVDADWFYEGQETVLKPDSTLLLYTDGLTEAMNAHHQQFGLQRVKEVINEHPVTTSQQLLDNLLSASGEFVAGAEQSDDLTMLAVKFTPQDEETLLRRELSITNDLSHLAQVNYFVKSIGDELKFAPSDTQNLKLAIEEAVVNVINYAYPAGEKGEIGIEATATATALRFKITDTGVAFAPTDAPDVDTSLTAEERQIGGLGIFLVRQLMDTINYERIDRKNVLTLTKKITS